MCTVSKNKSNKKCLKIKKFQLQNNTKIFKFTRLNINAGQENIEIICKHGISNSIETLLHINIQIMKAKIIKHTDFVRYLFAFHFFSTKHQNKFLFEKLRL